MLKDSRTMGSQFYSFEEVNSVDNLKEPRSSLSPVKYLMRMHFLIPRLQACETLITGPSYYVPGCLTHGNCEMMSGS